MGGALLPQKGNDRNSGYELEEHEWYVEPRRAIDALLDVEPFEGVVLDPACGGGNIVQGCLDRGIAAIGSDIVDRGYGNCASGVDFFSYSDDVQVDNIITNPPFSLINPWIEKCVRMAARKVAIIGRLQVLEGRARLKIFRTTPIARVWVFSSRISMPPGAKNVPAKNGSTAYAWFVWDFTHWGNGDPTIGWLP